VTGCVATVVAPPERYRPGMRAVVSMLFAVLTTCALLAGAAAAQTGDETSVGEPPIGEAPVPAGAIADLHVATDAARAAHGLPPLRPDPGLARAATAHAFENARRGVLDHGSPDPARATPADRVALAGVALVEIGENLARIPGASVARRAVDGWLASPPHRRNLLDPGFTHVGFGVADGPGGRYVVQLFGARPIERIALGASAALRTSERWRFTLDGPAGTDAMAFVDGRPVARARLGEGGTTVRVDALPAPTHLVLGVASGRGSYVPSDAGTLDPAAGWRRDAGAPFGPVQLSDAAFEASSEPGVEVRIGYRTAPAALHLLVGGRHRPDVRQEVATDGVWLRAWLPVANERRSVSVGVLADDDTIRVVESFTLTSGPAPALLPGRPSTVAPTAP